MTRFRTFRRALGAITITTACTALATLLISTAALRDHYSGEARLTPAGLQNMWVLAPLSGITCLINLVGTTGACFHVRLMLLVYAGAGLLSLLLHFSAQALGLMHLLDFTADKVNGSSMYRTSPLIYQNTLHDLRLLVAEAQPGSEEQDEVLRELVRKHANETDSLGNATRPPARPTAASSERHMTGAEHPSPNQAGALALQGKHVHDIPLNSETGIQSARGRNITDAGVAGEGGALNSSDQSLRGNGTPPSETVLRSLALASLNPDDELAQRPQGRLLIRHMELAVRRKLLGIGSLQRRFQCCGTTSYRDYPRRNLTVPVWCCRRASCDRQQLLNITLHTEPAEAARLIFPDGCGAILHKVSRYVNGAMAVLQLVVVAAQVVGCVLALGLATWCRPKSDTAPRAAWESGARPFQAEPVAAKRTESMEDLVRR